MVPKSAVPMLPAAPDADFDRFAAMVQRVIGTPIALVTLAVADGLIFPGGVGLDEPYLTDRRAEITDHFTSYVVRTGEALVVEDASTFTWDTAVDDLGSNRTADFGVAAYLGVPLTDPEGEVIGALCALDRQPRSFSEREVADLAELGVICSRVLAHRVTSRRLIRAQKRAKQISRLNRLLLNFSEALGDTTTKLDISRTLRELSHTSLDSEFCALILEQDGQFEAVDADGLPSDVPLAYANFALSEFHPGTALIRDRQPRFFEDRAALWAEFPALADTSSGLVEAQCLLPVVLQGQCTGWIWLGWSEPRENITEAREVKVALARYASQALERAQLLQERQDVAQTLQEALLATLPTIPGVELAARYLPASTHDKVGGDWYDAISVGDRTTLIMGDVVGHNIAAAAQMGQLRAILRGFAVDKSEAPADLLTRLDRANTALDGGVMATALVAHIDAPPMPGALARLTWSSAGHPQPILVGPDGSVEQLTGATDLLLGLNPQASRQNHVHHIEPGSTLILFTDGLVERRETSIQLMTAELCRLASALSDMKLIQMLDTLVHEMGDSQERDDVAVLAARLS